jgi:hypothetical protein
MPIMDESKTPKNIIRYHKSKGPQASRPNDLSVEGGSNIFTSQNGLLKSVAVIQSSG